MLKTNPGGQLNPEEILGRDALIADLWQILAGRNIYMNDLRRIGKTMILRKMAADPPPGWLVTKRDIGGLRTAAEFASQVYRDADRMLGGKKRVPRRMVKAFGSVDEVAGVLKLKGGGDPWKEILSKTIADLHDDHVESGEVVVFFWDEVPFMLDNIRTDESPQRAMEVLDTIRSLSQDYPGIRFVLTGSVGIHHVLGQLRKEGYNNSPLNTFERVAPGPISHQDGVDLAGRLLSGEGIEVEGACAEAVSSLTGDVPFYIHRLVARLPKTATASPASIERQFVRELTDADSDWDLGHYRTRLDKYYPDDTQRKIVLTLLDSVALAGQPLPFSELANLAKSKLETDDEAVRELLKLLLADHYLARDEQGHYHFRLEIVRRWWVLDRGL